MIMKTSDFSEWVQRFFREYLSRQRNVSAATVAAYRDTFRLLVRYWRQRRRQDLATSSLEVLTPDAVLGFLDHLEESRGNTIRYPKRSPGGAALVRALPDRLVRAGIAGGYATHFDPPIQAAGQAADRLSHACGDRSDFGRDR